MYYNIFIIITYSTYEVMVHVNRKKSKENQRFLFLYGVKKKLTSEEEKREQT